MELSKKERLRKSFCYLFVLLVASQLVISTALSPTAWWSLGVNPISFSKCTSDDPCPTCEELQGTSLSTSQGALCKKSDVPIKAIARGVRQAIISCQAHFSNSRWNCSTFFGEDLFGVFVNDGTRETAVLYALLTAGAASGIAKACHNQEIENCNCVMIGDPGEDEKGDLIFYACDDNADFALDYIGNFANESTLDVADESTLNVTKGLMNVHNTKIGQEAIQQKDRDCACHGVSGTCSVQTCYQKVQELDEIGKRLFELYPSAIKVQSSTNGLENVDSLNTPPDEDDLVFVKDSPSFCTADLPRGILGSRNRLCDPNPNAKNSCQVLCCDRGHYVHTYQTPREVCQFVWCCRIDCHIEGYDTIREYRCRG